MNKLLVEISVNCNVKYCHGSVNCSQLRYIGSSAYCSLFDKNLREKKDSFYPYRCKECKEAEEKYILWEQDKGYRHPFYQVED